MALPNQPFQFQKIQRKRKRQTGRQPTITMIKQELFNKPAPLSVHGRLKNTLIVNCITMIHKADI